MCSHSGTFSEIDDHFFQTQNLTFEANDLLISFLVQKKVTVISRSSWSINVVRSKSRSCALNNTLSQDELTTDKKPTVVYSVKV